MCPLQGDGIKSTFTRAIGKKVDIVFCKVEGIILGLESVVEYYRGTIYRASDKVLYILCGCDCATESILKGNFECSSLSNR